MLDVDLSLNILLEYREAFSDVLLGFL